MLVDTRHGNHLSCIVNLVANDGYRHHGNRIAGSFVQAVDTRLCQEQLDPRVGQNVILGCPINQFDVGPHLQGLPGDVACIKYVGFCELQSAQ